MKAPEYENDLRLVHLVDLQRIAENTKYIIARELPSSDASVSNSSSIGVHLRLLVSDLEKFKITLPLKFQQDCKIASLSCIMHADFSYSDDADALPCG